MTAVPARHDQLAGVQEGGSAVLRWWVCLVPDDELEGVIAHELSHVRNYDILTSSIAATIAGAITYIASMGRWAMIFTLWRRVS